jgi:tetratricopeptide (TPR) repeat protein
MSARARVYTIVAVVALAAAAAVVGVTLATRTGPAHAARTQAKAPPLLLDLGVRIDPEAVALRRAAKLYAQGKRAEAGRIFRRYRSVSAEVGAVVADWPRPTVPGLRALAAANPRSALVQLHYGIALLADGKRAAAKLAFERAAAAQPDTVSAIRAGNVLHPTMAPGMPLFHSSFSLPTRVERLQPWAQLEALAREAAAPSARAKLLYGLAFQALGKHLSAERQFRAAARLAPTDPEARVAAAVGLFDKDRPQVAFKALRPLARRFPHAQTVPFHLGVMLLWIGQVRPAKRQLALAQADAPHTRMGREAAAFLKRLRKIG